jgi:acetylornithine deacetylase
VTTADDIVASLAPLVGFATESRQSNRELLDWVEQRVAEAGGRVTLLPGAPGRSNLLASFGPSRPGGVLLSGHSDVVPAGDGWSSPPYELVRHDDRLTGRGTADMKGFIAVALGVLGSLDQRSLVAPVHLALSYDEEIGCAGVPGLLEHVAASAEVRPDLVVIGEPTMMRPSHRHLGKVAFELEFAAAAAHSSRSHAYPSAITSAARVVAAIDQLNERFRPASGSEPTVSLNCGVIRGGNTLNVVADQCHLSFEIRHSAEHAADDLVAIVQATIDAERRRLEAVGGHLSVSEVIRYPALATDTNHPLVSLVERIADAGPAQPIGYGTEGGLFHEALGVPIVICGPGDIAVAHRADEYVEVAQLLRCDRFLRELLAATCGDR